MKYNSNPRNNDKLSVLGFGCMRFAGNRITDSFMGGFDAIKAENLIVAAYEKGINYFDTAYLYTGSEEVLGNTVEKYHLRDKIFIATKLPLFLCRKPEDLDKYFEIQLKRLKTDYIDYYLLHMLTDMRTWNTLCNWGIQEWVDRKKALGQIRNFGFSFHGSQSEFLSLLAAYDWDFCQIQYNYSDENYQAGVTGLKAAAKKGIAVMIMEPLLGGKLARNLPAKAVARFQHSNAALSPAAWGFRWLYHQPEVTVVLSGMNEAEQLNENVLIADTAAHGMLSSAELQVIADVKQIFQASYPVHCTGCHYCMPCPAGVNIPACFAAYNTKYSISKFEALVQYSMSTMFTEQTGFASLCKQCGKCEAHCPQNLPIRENLKKVRKELEGVPFRLAKKIAPLFVKKR